MNEFMAFIHFIVTFQSTTRARWHETGAVSRGATEPATPTRRAARRADDASRRLLEARAGRGTRAFGERHTDSEGESGLWNLRRRFRCNGARHRGVSAHVRPLLLLRVHPAVVRDSGEKLVPDVPARLLGAAVSAGNDSRRLGALFCEKRTSLHRAATEEAETAARRPAAGADDGEKSHACIGRREAARLAEEGVA